MAFSSGVMRYFYPRPPRGRRRCGAACFHLPDMISIHALREEGDRVRVAGEFPRQEFLSTPSARRATRPIEFRGTMNEISIHALREEGDRMDQPITRAEHISIHALCEEGDSRVYPHPAVIIYFYPRPLRGGRRAKAAIEDADEIFLSTPSARRATHELDHGQRAQVISIHALCEEGDVDRADVPEGVVISIHALCEEGDSALL